MSGRTADLGKFEETWEFEIGGLIADSRFSHVFADVSYFWWVLDGRANDEQVKAVKQLFARYLERFDPEVKTLLFGTDWSMTARASAFEGYVEMPRASSRMSDCRTRSSTSSFSAMRSPFSALKLATRPRPDCALSIRATAGPSRHSYRAFSI